MLTEQNGHTIIKYYIFRRVSMGKNKKNYYAVKVGLVPGIYTSWGECQQNINGFPGAIHRGFATLEEAEAFMAGEEIEKNDSISRIYSEADAVAYVDGSFNPETSEYAYGVVIFYDGGEEHFAEKFNDPAMSQMNNVAGEIEGAKRVMRFCYESGIKSLDLFYDYEGIANWCTGAWQANKEGTREYKHFYNSIKDSVKVNFVKVKAHTGVTYNEIADALAKEALGLQSEVGITDRSNGAVATGIKKSDLDGVLELLKEDFPDLLIAVNDIPYATQYELRIEKPNKQKLIINLYESKNKIWVSGRKEDLFNVLTTYIVELLETDKIPEFLNTIHNLSVDKDIVESEFIKFFPNSYNKLPKEICNYLHQAVYNLHIEGDMYVTNYLVEPAIRPLEGVLKQALLDNGLPIRQEDKDYDTFFVFKEKEFGYVLKEQYQIDSMSRDMNKYLCKCYKFYRENRHTLFHWDNPLEVVDTTRVITTVAQAQVIIRDTISLIDEYYTF